MEFDYDDVRSWPSDVTRLFILKRSIQVKQTTSITPQNKPEVAARANCWRPVAAEITGTEPTTLLLGCDTENSFRNEVPYRELRIAKGGKQGEEKRKN